MYNNKRILALIPARGGSKGIKNKNITDLCRKPLIGYTIDSAIKSSYIDRIIVSTDSESIAAVSREWGAEVPFMRPKELAEDTSKTIDVVVHLLNFLDKENDQYDILVLLQPTQPLRTEKDIDKSIELFFEKGLRGLASVSLVDDNPILVRTISDDMVLSSLLGSNSTCRRQDMNDYYRVNGGIYINLVEEISANTSFNDNPVGFIMSPSHSVDIDEEKDLVLAEYYIKKRKCDEHG